MERRDDTYYNDGYNSNVIQKDHRQCASKDEAVVTGARKRCINIKCNEKTSRLGKKLI